MGGQHWLHSLVDAFQAAAFSLTGPVADCEEIAAVVALLKNPPKQLDRVEDALLRHLLSDALRHTRLATEYPSALTQFYLDDNPCTAFVAAIEDRPRTAGDDNKVASACHHIPQPSNRSQALTTLANGPSEPAQLGLHRHDLTAQRTSGYFAVRQVQTDRAARPMDRRIVAALTELETSFAKPDITLTYVARRANLSPSHFDRLLRQETGLSFREHLHNLRLFEATRCLEQTEVPIKAIAYSVGFTHPSHFDRFFRQHCGCSPRDWRRDPQLRSVRSIRRMDLERATCGIAESQATSIKSTKR